MSDWKTAAQWADEKLAGMPGTKRNVNALAIRDGWNDLGPSFARPRKARGGGWEYHVSCLPDASQAAWRQCQEVARSHEVIARQEMEAAEAIATAPEAMSARCRQVMEARAAVLLEIDRRSVGGGWDRAAKGLLGDAAEGLLAPALAQTLTLACDRKRGAVPSRSTIYEWRKARTAGGVQALAPVRSTQQMQAPPPAFLDGVLRFYGKTGVTLAHAVDLYTASLPEGAEAPSYWQAQRAMKALAGTDRFLDAHKGREGPLQLKARLGFKRRTVEGMEPTTVYTADGKTFDASVAHPVSGRPFRPEITTVIDVVTRRVVGWSVGLAENSRGVADALRRACEFGGIPAIFYTDNGAGYRNEALDHDTLGIAATLGIMTTHSLPYNSQARGIIERANGTIWNRLAQEFTTYQGPLVDREHRQKVHKAIRRDVAELGTSRLLPSWAEFMAAVEATVAEYNAKSHRSLRVTDAETGRPRVASPDEVWAEFVSRGFEPVGLRPGEADALFRPTIRRKVARGEIQYLGNHYYDQALEPFHGMEVLVGIDIQDASRIWVRRLDLIDGAPHPGALICVAGYWTNKTRYMPVTMQQAAEEKRLRGQLRRIEDKRVAIEANSGPALIEHLPEVPASLIDAPREAEVVMLQAPAPAQMKPRADAPGRKVMSCYQWDDDVEEAATLLADPSVLTPGRARLMNHFLGFRHADEMLRMGGVDPDELRDLLEDYAASTRSTPSEQRAG